MNKSIENLVETTKPNDTIIAQQQQQPQHQHHQVNLHKHVCSIANKCTCEKKFLVDKIGEGKYRIGNTKNIVFIRVNICIKTLFIRKKKKKKNIKFVLNI